MHKKTDAQLVVNYPCEHGEGPVWDKQRRRLLWVDMKNPVIHEYDPAKSSHTLHFAPEPACALAPLEAGVLTVAFAKQICRINQGTTQVDGIADVEPDLPKNRCNDGKVDPTGRFWIGTMSLDERPEGAGSLYRLERNGSLTRVLGDLTVANGLDWATDGRTMFFIDSPQREIWAFDFNPADSSISNKRTAVTVPDSLGVPDGMAVDADDTLWVAHWGSGCVCRWNPRNGKLLARVETGCPHTTSCIFGGSDGKNLYITTSRLGLSFSQLDGAPDSGSLFMTRT